MENKGLIEKTETFLKVAACGTFLYAICADGASH